MPFVFSIKDTYRQAVEAATGGKNTVMYDDKGNPSIMVAIPRFNIADVIDGGPNDPHPAFIVNGVTKDMIYVSKFQNIVHDSRAYSLPGQDPTTSVDFDQAVNYSKNKGAGWHLMTNAEWAAIALWCKKNGFMPRGNNDYGNDIGAPWEKGVETYGGGDPYQTYRVATGSGPATWAHDGTNDGIFDLNGNVREWTGGLRTLDGEIQVLVDNNASINTKDQTAASTEWKAIASADGAYVVPGTAGTLKYDATSPIQLSDTITTIASVYNAFEDIAVAAGVGTAPAIAKALGLAPVDANHGGDRLYVNTEGERLPYRGGNWIYGTDAGVFYLLLNYERTNSSSDIGFRCAFIG